MSAATWPTFSLSMPLTTMRVGLGDLEGDALRGVDDDGMAEPEREADGARALGLGPVADAHDLQLLAEAGGDAHHHVVDERAGEPVEAAALTLVVRSLDHDVPSSWRTEMAPGITRESVPLGPFTVTVRSPMVTSTPLGTVMGDLPMRLI